MLALLATSILNVLIQVFPVHPGLLCSSGRTTIRHLFQAGQAEGVFLWLVSLTAEYLIFNNLIRSMMPVRTRIFLACIAATMVLLSAISTSVAQEGLPAPAGNSDLVTYQITPLPPITEVSAPGDIPPPVGPELIEASEAPAVEGEEVQPLEPTADAEGEGAGEDEELQDEMETDLEILPEDESWYYLWRLWEVDYELGVNGSVGNSNTHTWRTAVRSKRKTDFSVLTGNVTYKKSIQESETTADRLYGEWRAEFPFPENKWSLFVQGNVEFDAFRSYDARLTKNAGMGYQWYKTDVGSFITRAGAGTSREFGGPDDQWVPEGVLGAEYARQLTKKQKLNFTTEFFYDITNVSENRINSTANWEVILDEEANLSLKVGIINRYDSTPNGSKPNDLDYSTVLLWSF